MASLFEGIGLAAGSPPEAKLRALLAKPAQPPRRTRGREPAADQPRLEREARSLSRCERAVITVLRRRAFGATVHTIAALSGVSAGHVRRCLRRIERRGWALSESRSRLWGYKQLRLRMWRLTWSDSCAKMLAVVRLERIDEQSRGFDDMVPPEFWFFNFWSGTPADQLTISANGLLIAETLITGHDPAARQWALAELPLEVLAQCRQLRGCDSGSNAADIDAAIAGRCG